MKVAIIQSNYIPWKGYFDIINSVDEFILYDDVQYTKNDWRNRNKIKTKQGVMWLSIPVHHHLNLTINEIKVSDKNWRKKHWRAIKMNYSKSKFFHENSDIFEDLYLNNKDEYLSDINYKFINIINSILKIKTKIKWSSEFELKGGKIERLIDLCIQLNATEYLSGPSAKTYLNDSIFKQAGIKLKWMDYSGYPEYNQLYPPFSHEVSIIDLIFNEGPNTAKFMKSFI